MVDYELLGGINVILRVVEVIDAVIVLLLLQVSLLLSQQAFMQDVVDLAIHLVVEVNGPPDEIASSAEGLFSRDLSPIFLLIHCILDNVISVAWEYYIISLYGLLRSISDNVLIYFKIIVELVSCRQSSLLWSRLSRRRLSQYGIERFQHAIHHFISGFLLRRI